MLSNAVIEPREIRREVRSEGFFPPKWDKKKQLGENKTPMIICSRVETSPQIWCVAVRKCVCVCVCLFVNEMRYFCPAGIFKKERLET